MKKILSLFMVVTIIVSLCSCQAVEKIREKYFSYSLAENKTEIINNEHTQDVANVINVCMYDFDTFNPLMTLSQSVRDAMKFVYEPLFTLDSEFNSVNVLASEYWVNDDGKTVIVKLKDGVSWHDGSQLSAYDVSYTINCIAGGMTNYSLDYVTSCSIVDNMRVQINFNHSLPNPTALLTFPIIKNRTSMNINPSYVPIGTGPFSYSGKVSIDRYMLLASDYYHNQKSSIGGIYIELVPDNERYFTMFNSGNADVCNGALIRDYEYTPKGSIQVNEYISNELIYLGINNKSSFLTGKNTRQALANMIDRKAIEEKVMYSTVKAVDTPINPSSPFYMGKDEIRTDGIKAQELLQADGYVAQTKGYTKVIGGQNQQLKLVFLVNGDSEQDIKIAEKIHENLNMNGVKIVMDIQPYDVFMNRIVSGNYDIFLGAHNISANMDISNFLGGTVNYFGYENITIDMIINQMGITREDEGVRALYEQLSNVLNDDMPIIPIAFKKDKIYTSSRIKNVAPVGADVFYADLYSWSIK